MVPSDKIPAAAKEQNVIVGPERPHHAITGRNDPCCPGEMKRQGFKVPLLIGGATTSRVHTAVKTPRPTTMKRFT